MRFLYVLLLLSYITAQPIYEFSGNKDYSNSSLESLIGEDWQKYLENDNDVSYIDDAAYKILQNYRDNGYHFAIVDYQIEKSPETDEHEKILFVIQEYKSIVVKEVHIKSTEEQLFFEEQRLKKFITPPPALGEYLFKKNTFRSDAAAIQTFYRSKGFLKTEAQVDFIFSPEKPNAENVNIEVTINEGPRAYLEKLEFINNNAFAEAELLKIVPFEKGQIFTPGTNQDMAAKLRDFYRENSYAQIKIRSRMVVNSQDKKRDNITIQFLIEEKKPNYIHKITIQGNDINDVELIAQQLDVVEGQLFRLSDIISTEQNLQRCGLFLYTEIEEVAVAEDKVDLNILVKERNRQTYSFLAGYNTIYGVVGGVRYENISFLGSGWVFIADVESTIFAGDLEKSELEISFTNPWAFGRRDLAFTAKGFALLEETPSFTIFNRGADFFFTHYLWSSVSESGLVRRLLTAEAGYRLDFSEIIDVEDTDIEEEEGLVVFSTIHQKLTLDLRDNIIYPLWGTYSFIEFEESFQGLGSDVDYFKMYIHNAWYFNVFLDWVLAIALRGGVVIPFGDTDEIPIQKRFFGGGPNSVRSFAQNEMPPLDDEDNPIGGEGIFLASAELRIPIFYGLGITLFGDCGEVIERVRTFNDYRISQVKYAIGGGIWYNIPHLGALRVDYAYNPDRDVNPSGSKEDASQVFISIGFAF
ncbi:BamA/OMP85 family outer membrane protein [Candidatus Uabimicrobium amorphum]|uniref:Outer membrane protein, OMP85 family n=1 Tax=Uabimicrobium amorphum TaxID=2596890 RepID=A0A5S9IKG0_UABAM|nr:BamA/TamA family outer membrane protein [Candidatus Uabimicrobium amorphum]BBM83513.1 outer membrane protein, OMP85 family [Candidatus Uabimicrobium amorphum]